MLRQLAASSALADHAGRLACSSCVTAEQPAAFLKGRHHLPLAAMTAQPQCPRSVTVGIGFSIFLFVVGAILTFAVEVEASGFTSTQLGSS
jgi:hypothetical protein